MEDLAHRYFGLDGREARCFAASATARSGSWILLGVLLIVLGVWWLTRVAFRKSQLAP